MSVLGSAIIRIGSDLAGFDMGLKQVQAKLNQMGAKLKTAFASEPVVAASNKIAMGLGVIGVAGAVAAGAFGLASIKAAGDMEQTRIAFDTLLGSAQQSKAFLSELAGFAARTPFELKGLQQSSKLLLAFGFQAKEIIPMMTAIGDASAGIGGGEEGVNRIVRALGQMKAKGKVSAEEMMQIAELGIPAWEYLAKAAGKSVAEMMDASQKGALGAEGAISAILAGMQGKFGGMMDKQANTLLGSWSNLMDGFGQAMIAMGDQIIQNFPLKDLLQAAGGWLSDFATYVSAVGIREALGNLVPEWLELSLYAVAGAITVAMIPSLISGTVALWGMAKALWATMAPILPLIALGVALGVVAYLLVKAWGPVSKFFVATWKVAAAAFKTGVAGIMVFGNELKLGFATMLNFLFGSVARFVSGLARAFAFLENVPGLGAFVSGVENAANSVSGVLEGFQDSAAAGLDRSKATFAAASAEMSAPWDDMKQSAVEAGGAIVDVVKDVFDKTNNSFNLHNEVDKIRKSADGLATSPNAQKAPPVFKDIEDKATKAGKATDGLKDLLVGINDKGLIAARRAFETTTMMGDVRGRQVSLSILEAAGATPNRTAINTDGQTTVVHSGTVRVEGVNDRGQLVGVTAVVADELLKGQDRFSNAPSKRRVFK